MSEQGGRRDGGGWPDDPSAGTSPAAPGAPAHHAGRSASEGPSRSTRTPLLVALGVLLLVVGVVVGILVMTNSEPEPEVAPTLEPEIVEAPVPTPTAEPIEVPEGTAFFEALPRTVLQYVLLDLGDEPEREDGVAEAYALTYGDGGGTEVVATAVQWRDPEAAAERLAQVRAELAEEHGDPSTPAPAEEEPGAPEGEDPTTAPRFEEGDVRAGQDEVGRYLLLVREDGTATVWWTNTTALLRLDGPARAVRDMYAAFPL